MPEGHPDGKDVKRMFSSGPRYKNGGKILMIPVEDIRPNPDQPRKAFDQEKLRELAQSLKENGMLQPVTVVLRGNRPVLVAGERRWRAAKMAGLQEIPCIAVEARREKGALLALLENLQREDMNCFEEAEGYARLIEVYGLTQEEAAARLGCSQSAVANKLRLLRLSEEQRARILAAGLTERHARALLRLPDEGSREAVLWQAAGQQLTVAETERLVEKVLLGEPEKRGRRRKKPTPLIRDIRLFLNTVEHAVDTMRRSGVAATAQKEETEEYIEYVVRIPKQARENSARPLTIHTA